MPKYSIALTFYKREVQKRFERSEFVNIVNLYHADIFFDFFLIIPLYFQKNMLFIDYELKRLAENIEL